MNIICTSVHLANATEDSIKTGGHENTYWVDLAGLTIFCSSMLAAENIAAAIRTAIIENATAKAAA